jgi:hypothetical protein
MERRSAVARTLEFEDLPKQRATGTSRNSLRLATLPGELRGPDKYRVLDLRRRRAQIRARRALLA